MNAIGQKNGPPVPPLNLVGDFGGGGIYMAFGLVAACWRRGASGKGQVVDAAMVDGAASFMTSVLRRQGRRHWDDERGGNALNGGAHYYKPYETKDGRYISIASIEPQFFNELLERLGIKDEIRAKQHDRAGWPDAAQGEADRGVQDQDPDEWCRSWRARSLLRAGARPGRGDAASAQQGAGTLRRGGRDDAAGSGAALQPHAEYIQALDPRIGAHNETGLMDWGLTRDEVEALRHCGAL